MATFVWILLALGVFVYYGFKEGHRDIVFVIAIIVAGFLLFGSCAVMITNSSGEQAGRAFAIIVFLLIFGYPSAIAIEGFFFDKKKIECRKYKLEKDKEKAECLSSELAEAGYNISDKFYHEEKSHVIEYSLSEFAQIHIPPCWNVVSKVRYEHARLSPEEFLTIFDGYYSIDEIYSRIVQTQKSELTCIDKDWIIKKLYPYVRESDISNKETLSIIFMAYLGLYEDTPESDKAKEIKKRMEDAGYHLNRGSIVRIAFSSSSPVNNLYSETPAKDLYEWECCERIRDFWQNGTITYRADSLFEKLTGKKIVEFPLPQTEDTSFALKVRNFYEMEYVLKSEGLEAIKFYSSEFTNTEERKKVFEDYACVFYGAINSANPEADKQSNQL